MASPPFKTLCEAIAAMPPGSLVPRDWLLEQLSGGSSTPLESPALVDLPIGELARLFGKRPSTVRAWVERGDFPGAYKLHGKEWRVPASAIKAFQNRQRGGSPTRDSRHGGRSGGRMPQSGQKTVLSQSLRRPHAVMPKPETMGRKVPEETAEKPGRPRLGNQVLLDRMVELREQGFSHQEIAEKVDRSPRTVRRYTKGVSPRLELPTQPKRA